MYCKFYPDIKYRKLEKDTPPWHFYILKFKKKCRKKKLSNLPDLLKI